MSGLQCYIYFISEPTKVDVIELYSIRNIDYRYLIFRNFYLLVLNFKIIIQIETDINIKLIIESIKFKFQLKEKLKRNENQ